MTTQEAFNRLWDWYVVQKKSRSTDSGLISGAVTMYHGPDGLRSPFGLFIPAGKCNLKVENTSPSMALVKKLGLEQTIPMEVLRLIWEVEVDHNRYNSPGQDGPFDEFMAKWLRNTADMFKLDSPD